MRSSAASGLLASEARGPARQVRSRRRARAPRAPRRSHPASAPGRRSRCSRRGSVNCLVLDEPTNHLDLPAIEQLESALAETLRRHAAARHPRPRAARRDRLHPPHRAGTWRHCRRPRRHHPARVRSTRRTARTVATAAVRAVTSAASPPSLMLGTPPPHDAVATRRSRRSSTERSAAEALDVLPSSNQPPATLRSGHRPGKRHIVSFSSKFTGWKARTNPTRSPRNAGVHREARADPRAAPRRRSSPVTGRGAARPGACARSGKGDAKGRRVASDLVPLLARR